jgi:hypothetical protein
MKHLPKRKAPGHDNISNIDLRNLSLNTVTHLTWKEANVISIPKPNNNPAFPQDRRPVSLLDTMGNVMEKEHFIDRFIQDYHAPFPTNNFLSY